MIKILLFTLTILFSNLTFAKTPIDLGLKEGIDFISITPKNETLVSDKFSKPVLIDFFWYGCPHCFKMKPLIDETIKKYGSSINVIHYPVPFHNWEQGTKVFFTLQKLNLFEKYHSEIFNIIHTQGIKLHENQDALLKFFQSKNEDVSLIKNTLNSFEINSKVNQAKKVIDSYQIQSTPVFALVIDGKTYLVDPAMLKSYEKTNNIIDTILKNNINNKSLLK
jgi:thiol:disulfide interchange protein DsbA